MQINKMPYGIHISFGRVQIDIWRPGLWEPRFFILDSILCYAGCRVYATPILVVAIRRNNGR
jgi:hypothetical protein